MIRNRFVALVAALLVVPALAAAHDDEFESDWGWIDDGVEIEEYDFERGDVSVDMTAPGPTVSFETFESGLAPHGQWVSVGAYGRVWRPYGVATGWRPYYHGRWEWTDEGWLWVSAEPWGWATYHYGRWAFDSFYGWVWVPGYQWAPAWVTWRFGVDYIGWAPLGPGLSVYVTNYPVVYDHWCFVPSRRFVGVPVHTIGLVGRPRVAPLFTRTQPAPPRATVHGSVAPAWGGPARPFVEKRVGRPISPVRVQPVASPAAARAAAPREGGAIPVYRPEAAPRRPGARGNALAAPGVSRGSQGGAAVDGPSRREGGSQAAPARPNGGASRGRGGDQVVRQPQSVPPPAAVPAPSAPPPRSGSAQGSGSRGGSGGPAVAPAPSRGGGGDGGSPAVAPPPSRGGGGSVAPPSRGGGGGGSSRGAVAPAPSRGGGGGGGGGGSDRGGGGNSTPGRR